MIKRLSIILCVVLLLVVTLAVPSFAAETSDNSSIYFVKQPVDSHIVLNETFKVSVVVYGDVSSYQWQFSFDEGETWFNSTSVYANQATYSTMIQNNNAPCYRCVVTGVDGSVIISDVSYTFIYPLPILSYSSRAILFVTEWLGSIIDALTSSDGAFYSLLPVLAVGISITLFLLVTKIFKSFSWGL